MNTPQFPSFKDLSIEDKSLFDEMFRRFPPLISEFTFTNLFIWRKAYSLKFTRVDSFLCLLGEKEGLPFFFPPIGEGDMIRCLRALIHFLKEKTDSPQLLRVPEGMARQIDWKREGLRAELDRDQSDYVYLIKDLIQLEGRRYHRKRNHIKQFKERYTYQYVPLTADYISQCLELEEEWCHLRHCEVNPGLTNEIIAIKEALTSFEKLKLKGGAILIEGKVQAFTLGEPLNPETVVIHIEKANPAFEGLYAMINQAFLENEWSHFTYVNREQDLGEEGLRKAKESYFPHYLVHKYKIILDREGGREDEEK
jgi:hypothetical protein